MEKQAKWEVGQSVTIVEPAWHRRGPAMVTEAEDGRIDALNRISSSMFRGGQPPFWLSLEDIEAIIRKLRGEPKEVS